VLGVAVTVTGQTVRQENRSVGKEEYCGGCGNDSDRAETEGNLSMCKDECCDSWNSDTDSADRVTGNLISGEDRAEL
jgi:hypothetical protein